MSQARTIQWIAPGRDGPWRSAILRYRANPALRQSVEAICRPNSIDTWALSLAAIFMFLATAFAICAQFAIGAAPADRMWSFFLYWISAAFTVTVLLPWLLCRAVHAGMAVTRVVRRLRPLQLELRASAEPSATAPVH